MSSSKVRAKRGAMVVGWIAVAMWAALAAPDAAQACAVCGVGREENRLAFLGTTIFLSVLPLFAIGAIVVWLRHRARVVAAEAESEVSIEGAAEPAGSPAGSPSL